VRRSIAPACASILFAFVVLAGSPTSAAGAVPLPGPRSALAASERSAVGREDLPEPVPCVGCWQPGLVTSWQWQLQGHVDTSFEVQMYDIDGFEATGSLVSSIHSDGAAAVCYVDVGSWENWRPDAGRFPERVLGRSNGWKGERWLDIRRMKVLAPLMRERLGMCADKGFDGVELDLVDGYQNRTGFPLSGADQRRYNVFLANEAHRLGLSVALKNDLGQIGALLPYFDYAVNEQCHRYHECDRLDAFVEAGKAVFGVEYGLRTSEFCPKSNDHDFNFLKKDLDLRALPRVPCRGA
jgi:endo-alpha-1,4-polygalactosaminidase (GH114 family)